MGHLVLVPCNTEQRYEVIRNIACCFDTNTVKAFDYIYWKAQDHPIKWFRNKLNLYDGI